MKFNWKKREKESIKPLTEKEIQEQLYGFIKFNRKPEDKNNFIIKEIREKFEKEKIELVKQSAREKENLKENLREEKQNLIREKEKLLKLVEGKKRIIEEKDQHLTSLKVKLNQSKQELKTALSSRQQSNISNISSDNIPRKARFQISAIKTIFNLSPKFLILFLIILIGCFVSLKIIYSRIPQSKIQVDQIAKKTPLEPTKQLAVKYAVQICVYEKEDEAKRLVNNLKAKKYPAYFTTRVSSKGKTYYNICLGKFPTEKSASSFLNKIKGKKEFEEFKDSFVKKL